MWLRQENQINPFMIVEKVVIFHFLEINIWQQTQPFLREVPFSDSGPGSPGCLVLQCPLWLEPSLAMINLRQLRGDLDKNNQRQITCFKWRPGTPVSSSWNGQARVRRKPSSPGSSNSLAQDHGLHKMKSVLELSSMGANEFPPDSNQFEMNYLSFVTKIYILRKNDSKPITNSMLCSGTTG